MKIKKVYVILILNDEVIDLKTKIIAIVISVVITAGTATGVGIVVKQSNDKNTEDIVNAAISEALATADSSTSTTETTTTEESTTRKHLGAPQPTSTTETTTETTEEPQAIIIDPKSNGIRKPAVTTATTTTAPTVNKQDKDIDKSDLGTETPLGYVKKTDETKHKDDKGYYWETDFKYYRNGNKANSYDYFIDEEDYLFFFENGRRVYYVTHN